MKRSNTIGLLFVVLGIVIGTIFQFFKSDADEIAHLSQTMQQALQVKQLDTQLNEHALKAASFRLVHFDHIVQTVRQLSEVRLSLQQSVQQLPSQLTQRFTKLEAVIDQRIDQLERLKAKVALARNSSNFLLKYLSMNVDKQSSEIALKSLQAMTELQAFQLFPNRQRLKATQDILHELNEALDSEHVFQIVIHHLQRSFELTQDISALLNNVLANESNEAIDEFISHLYAVQTQRQNLSNGYRYILFGVAVLIFIALAYMIVRWTKERHRAQEAAQLFEDAVDSMSEGFAFFGPNQKLVFWNSTFARLHDPLENRLYKGMSWQEFEDTQKEVGFLLQSELQKDGSTLDLTCDGNWMLSANTHMHQGGYAVVRVDLTEQKRAQDQLQLAATVFQTASEAMMVTDKDDIIQMVNPAFSKITGYPEREVLGQSPTLLSSGHHNAAYYKKMYLDLQNTGTWQGEIWNRRKSGEIYPEWLSISTIYDDDGEVLQRVSLFTDITSRKKSEERIHYQANYDSLTDLPNRNLFKERLNHAINMARRSKDRVALLFLDLDNFKHINDTLGHLLGDELLRQVAERLRSLFRESDTIARLSGDEFVIIINEANYDPDLQHLLARLLECISLPYVLDGNTAYTSASVGATFFPDDAQSSENLLKNADAAMFKAKEMGRNTYSFFTPEMNSRAQERHTLEVALHKALDKKHFLLHYQPIVDPHTQTVVSTEALVRWNDPEKGLITPEKFIPAAEDTGLIVPMGEWILRQACADAAHWQQEEGLNVGVSVNLSSRQFMRSDIYGLVKDVLRESQLPASKLTLEITESLLVEDENEILKTLRKLRDLGVLLSIDDFGTGYSSLSYLKRFPITTLKIDRSFICDILSDSEDAALTQAILSMAKSMNLKVVAEGVENAGQAEYLKERQCDLIQGFYYSKPLALKDLLQSFKQKKLSA